MALYFQVPNVETALQALVDEHIVLTHGPSQVFWGFGIELRDPDGYILRLWDKRTMGQAENE